MEGGGIPPQSRASQKSPVRIGLKFDIELEEWDCSTVLLYAIKIRILQN